MARLKLLIEVKDTKTGKIELSRESHSWTKFFLWMLHCQHNYHNSTVTLNDTGGSARTISYNDIDILRTNAAIGDATLGIVVGTGSGAEDIDDYQLGTRILHGITSGTLQYGIQGWTDPATSGSDAYFTLTRTFTNGSGGDITVNEIGIYAYNATYIHCIARDLTGGVLIANGSSKTVTYTLTVTN